MHGVRNGHRRAAAAAAALKDVVPKVIDFIDGRDVNDL